MIPATADYSAHVRGDTINERIFTLTKTVNEVENPIDLTGCEIKADFTLQSSTTKKELGAGITLINALQGQFKIDSFSLDRIGKWEYDVEITFPSGLVKTWIKGKILIEDDVTK